VGPILDEPGWAEPWTSPWIADDRRPLAIISLSTTFMGQEKVLRRCIEAVASMPVRALVTVGPAMDPRAFPSSENVSIVASAPHDAVFPLADAIVTHAGMGTVTRGLAHGVPLVCLPLGRDQGDVAARVAWHGAGLRLGPGSSPDKIARALARVLDDPAFLASA
jgi:UDP:flavonoid glycosyltransferase YjiC (YdhE family)